jgi:hypothetical protein
VLIHLSSLAASGPTLDAGRLRSEADPPAPVAARRADDPRPIAAAAATASRDLGRALTPRDNRPPPVATAAQPTTRLVQGAQGLGRLLSLVPGRTAGNGQGTPADAPATTAPGAPAHAGHSSAAAAPLPPLRAIAPASALASASASAPAASAPAALSALGLPSAPPPTPAAPDDAAIDAVLDALLQRLHTDYLRHYGSAG